MNRYILSILAATLILLSCAGNLNAVKSSGKINSFIVQDAPFDDGAGIMMSWKPLPKEMRIIQYRIYRGIRPDSLFYFGQVEVDPTAGVASDMMYYYDKDYQLFLSIDSPGRLKREKQQPVGSPLYGRIPRDPKLMHHLASHFSLLGIVDNANLYKHSIKVTNPDGTVSAGLKAIQFEQVAANPLPGMKYYYTVLAVNEQGTFLPYADIRSAVPVDNPPDNSAKLSTVFVNDKGDFQMEWVSPVSSYDIGLWQFWLLPKSQLSAFQDWQKVYMQQGGSAAPWTKNAILLTEKSFDYNNFITIPVRNGKVQNPDGTVGPAVPVSSLKDYVMVLGVQDYKGQTSYSMSSPTRFMNAAQLPAKPVFTVADKPDDKGDTNTISFGKPISYITQASYINAKKTKIRINYEISDNQKYRIDAISFKISDSKGNPLQTIEERYPDKIIMLRVGKDTRNIDLLNVQMAFRFRGQKTYTEYYVNQSLIYNTQIKRFFSEDIFYKGEDLSHNYYRIFRKNLLESGYMATKKISAISRNYDDIVNFESTLQKMISGVDVKTGTLLLDPSLNFAVDNKSGMPLYINIYRTEEAKELKKMQDDLAKLKQQLKSNPAKADSLNQVITQQETYLNALLYNPVYQKSLKIKSQGRWLSQFHHEQLVNSRSYSYRIMKTDNEGAYTFSDESAPYIPIPNWFNMQFLLALIASIAFTIIVVYTSFKARRGKDLYLRPIAGLAEIDNAVGRATEMGRPILYVPGWGTIGDINLIASMMILNRVAKKTAEYDTRLIVPNCDYIVTPLAMEMVKDAYYEAGRPDSFNQGDIYFITDNQFPYAAGVNGIMIREKCATIFYMGYFNAEALLMTETGNSIGSIQIAGTDATTQVPFFITTCDYTLIGEEFYAASAYLSRDAELVAMLKAQDYFKFLILFFVILGAVLSTMHFNWLTNSFPLE
jgi:hypothetical protein